MSLAELWETVASVLDERIDGWRDRVSVFLDEHRGHFSYDDGKQVVRCDYSISFHIRDKRAWASPTCSVHGQCELLRVFVDDGIPELKRKLGIPQVPEFDQIAMGM